MIQRAGGCGRCGTIAAITRAVSAASVAAPSSSDNSGSPIEASAKSLRSSDFGGRAAKNGLRENALDERLVHLSPRCLAAFIERRAAVRTQEIVDQGVARTGVAGKRSLAVASR